MLKNDNGYELSVEDAATDDSLLHIEDERLLFDLHGNADVVLVDEDAKHHNMLLAGLCSVISVQRSISSENRAQAIAQLVAASMNAPENIAPMVLLTDLNDNWYFYWLCGRGYIEENNVMEKNNGAVMTTRIQYPKNAIEFMVASAIGVKWHFNVPFANMSSKIVNINNLMPRVYPK